MEDIKVSVCCLVYNHEKYLRKCLDGFVNQKTNFKYEVLIHDDASTDNSQSIIREYEEKYPDIIKPIYQTENQYSKGIRVTPTYQYPRAKGKYIALCEGDDYWCDDNKLQKQYDIMEQNPECNFCVCKVQGISESGKRVNKTYPNFNTKDGLLTSDEFLSVACHDYQFQTSGYFMRKDELFKYHDLDLSYKKAARIAKVGDWPLFLYFGSTGSVAYISDIMSCYRINSTESFDSKLLKDDNKRKTHYINMTNMMECFDKETNGRYSEYCNDFIFIYLCFAGEYKKAMSRKYRKAYKSNPFSNRMRVLLSAYFPVLVRIYEKIKGY